MKHFSYGIKTNLSAQNSTSVRVLFNTADCGIMRSSSRVPVGKKNPRSGNSDLSVGGRLLAGILVIKHRDPPQDIGEAVRSLQGGNLEGIWQDGTLEVQGESVTTARELPIRMKKT